MSQTKLTLFSKEYNLIFDYNTIRLLADTWNLDTPGKVEKKIFDVINKSIPKPKAKAVELTFSDLDVLQDTFYAALKTANGALPFTASEMMNHIIVTPGLLAGFVSSYINSKPKPDDTPNPNARGIRKRQ